MKYSLPGFKSGFSFKDSMNKASAFFETLIGNVNGSLKRLGFGVRSVFNSMLAIGTGPPDTESNLNSTANKYGASKTGSNDIK